MSQITIRSDRDTDYTFTYKGEEGLQDVVLPTCKMKIANNLIVIKE